MMALANRHILLLFPRPRLSPFHRRLSRLFIYFCTARRDDFDLTPWNGNVERKTETGAKLIMFTVKNVYRVFQLWRFQHM